MSRAAVFTHIDFRHGLEHPRAFIDFYKSRGGFFRSCLACRNIGVVFVYSSFGVGEYIAALHRAKKKAPAMPMNVLENEQRIYNALQLVLDRAARHVAGARAAELTATGPKFVFIGVRELASLLNLLQRINPELVESIACDGKFTYDSPKYVEAIIRIARPRRFTEEVVIRVDADVEVNEAAIGRILEQARLCREDDQFEEYWWFSGCYSGAFDGDPVNTHAVRQHWLVTPETRKNPGAFALYEDAEHFLADIAEIGATQDVPAAVSRPAAELVARRGYSNRRRGAQVISGAGLVASARAIERLPPFMNAPDLVVWVDDHLKRLLHEVIGDIGFDAPERIDARLRQDRYPTGIDDESDPAEFARFCCDYFERLLRGSLVEAMIQKRPGELGPLADCVFKVVQAKMQNLSVIDEEVLRADLSSAARRRFDEVMFVWKHAEYGDDRLRRWAWEVDDRPKDILYHDDAPESLKARQLIQMVVDMGISYVKLCLLWPDHVRAILMLSSHDAYWLFTADRDSTAAAPEWLDPRPATTAAPPAEPPVPGGLPSAGAGAVAGAFTGASDPRIPIGSEAPKS